MPWRRKWQPTPVFLPGKSHGQRGLEGYSLWGCRESDMTEKKIICLSSHYLSINHLSCWLCLCGEPWLTHCCCCCWVASVVSDSVWPHRRQPNRLLCPWDPPGKNTGVSCHFLLQCMKVKSETEVAQSCPTLSDPMDCSLPGFSIHGIFQARVLEWGAIAFSKIL